MIRECKAATCSNVSCSNDTSIFFSYFWINWTFGIPKLRLSRLTAFQFKVFFLRDFLSLFGISSTSKMSRLFYNVEHTTTLCGSCAWYTRTSKMWNGLRPKLWSFLYSTKIILKASHLILQMSIGNIHLKKYIFLCVNLTNGRIF